MKIQFTQYLHHEDEEGILAEKIFSQLPQDLKDKYLNGLPEDSDEAIDRMCEFVGSPFYEVCLNCELDTETNEITVLSVTGVRNTRF